MQDCPELFATELKKECNFKADLHSIDFLSPKDRPGLRYGIATKVSQIWEAVTNPIPLPSDLSEVLEGKLDMHYLHLLVRAEEATEPGRAHGEMRDVVPELGLPEVRRFIASLKKPSKAPAAYASNQKNPSTAIYDGRYVPNAKFATFASPIQIFHPIFEHFLRLLEHPDLQVTREDLIKTHKLMVKASAVSSSEVDGASNFRELLTEILKASFYLELSDDASASDGVATLVLGSKARVQLVVAEVKREWGEGGCDAVNQAGLSMRHYWTNDKNAEIRNKCCCPTFLIAGGGSWISILGGVYTDKFIVQNLTDMTSIGNTSTFGDDRAARVARMFVALRECLRPLSDFYANLSHVEPMDLKNLGAPHPRLYPYPSSYDVDGQQVNFDYVRALEDDAACVSFLARTEHAESPDIVVKFVSRYGQEVHRFLATDPDRLAPQLHYFGPLPDLTLPDDYHPKHMPLMSMVVMDYIKPSATPPDAYQQIKNALDKLHERGFVLGDLREPNVLFDEDGKLKLIDFDLAGRYKRDEHSTDFVRYPLNLSPVIEWPGGVVQLNPILPEHDLEMLDRLFSQ